MVAHIKTVAFLGVDAVAVDVQVHLAPGHNAFTVVGLPDKSVAESRERVRAALSAMGLALPYERITINLSPADLPKEGSHYDLPIALGLLVAMGGLTHDQVAPFVAMGELALDGACTPVPGALPAAMAALENNCGLICPAACGPEAAWSGLAQPDRPGIVAGGSLLQIVNHLRGTHLISPPEVTLEQPAAEALDMADIRGQGETRMALEVAAAGGHNLLMNGAGRRQIHAGFASSRHFARPHKNVLRSGLGAVADASARAPKPA